MFREMDYIYEVYKERSFTKAAQKLYISQPALSLMVKKAEQKLGASLFDRSSIPLELTEAGKYYIAQAERIMTITQETEAYFSFIKAANKHQLRLGGSSFFITYLYLPAIKAFRQICPDVEVQWTEQKNKLLFESLKNNNLDFFVEVDETDDPELSRYKLGDEQVILSVPASYRVNDSLKEYRLTIEDVCSRRHLTDDVPPVNPIVFEEYPFILLREGNDSYNRAMQICRNAGFEPQNIPLLADQVMTSYNLSVEGHGIAFIRDSILFRESAASKSVYYYKLDDPAATRSVYLYYRRKKLSDTAEKFLEFMKTYDIDFLS